MSGGLNGIVGASSSAASWIEEEKDDCNFKVVVRVRPALTRELPGHSMFASASATLPEHKKPDFQPIVKVSEQDRCCTLMEYVGAEVSDQGR